MYAGWNPNILQPSGVGKQSQYIWLNKQWLQKALKHYTDTF